MKTTLDIECRYCGGCTGKVSPGKGPHAYEVKCQECGKHTKWASAFDVEEHTNEQLAAMLATSETALNQAHSDGDFALLMKCKKNIEKIKAKMEKQIERV